MANFASKISQSSAAKAERPKPLPAAIYAAIVTNITWPADDDEPMAFTRDGKDIEYVRPTITCKLLEPHGEHDLEEEDYKQLPREFKFDVMITEDNPDAGLLVFQNLIYDALQIGDVDADAENNVPVVDKLEDCIGQEVLVETRIREWKTKDGEAASSTELRRFHAA